MEQVRPKLEKTTVQRLLRFGNYPPTTPIDYIINDVLDKVEGKKK